MRYSPLLCVCALSPCVWALSSSSPPDLAAFPKYHVVLNREVVSNATAKSLLLPREEARRENDAENTVEQPSGEEQGKENGSEATNNVSYELMRARNGQAFICSIPRRQPQNTSGVLAKEGQDVATLASNSAKRTAERKQRNEEMKQGLERGLQLLEPLKGFCIFLRQSWFTCELFFLEIEETQCTDAFCHGSEVRQFREIRVQGQATPAEDPNVEAYTLGRYPNPEIASQNANPAKVPSVGSIAARHSSYGGLSEILSENSLSLSGLHGEDDMADDELEHGRRYLVQRWDGGTVCDMTGLPRRVEVQFHCNTQSTDRIALIREVGICDYVLVVHTPRLCGEPVFLASSGSSENGSGNASTSRTPVDIVCRPVAKDGANLPLLGEAGESTTNDESSTAAISETVETPDAIPLEETPLRDDPQEDQRTAADETNADADDNDALVITFDPQTGEIVEASLDGEDLLSLSDAEKVQLEDLVREGVPYKKKTDTGESLEPTLQALSGLQTLLEEKMAKFLSLLSDEHEKEKEQAKEEKSDKGLSKDEAAQAMRNRLEEVMRLLGAKPKPAEPKTDAAKIQTNSADVIDQVLKRLSKGNPVGGESPTLRDNSAHQQLKGIYSQDFSEEDDDRRTKDEL